MEGSPVPRAIPGAPSMVAMDITPPLSPKSPRVVPSPKSPGFTSINNPTRAERSSTPSQQPSPLLLAIDELTPLNSRDEDSALYSDSDGASQNSAVAAGRGRRGTPTSDSQDATKPRKRNSSRRRRSDATERSTTRSLRSHSTPRDARYPHATKIFRNLLVLEQSLREQLQEQKSLRNRFTFFLAALAGIEAFTIYSLYSELPGPFPPVVLKFIAFFILVTMALFNLSGEYKRTIVIPRRFFTSTNKGLRQLNLRLVKSPEPLSDKATDCVRAVLRSYVESSQWCMSHLGPIKSLSICLWWDGVLKTLEVTAQPRVGPTDVKLMMNPRAFNAEIREAWEMYRDEFWAREGSRQRHDDEKDKEKEKERLKTGSSGGGLLDRETLLEKHRRERKDRRRSKAIDDRSALAQSDRGQSTSVSPVLGPAKVIN